MTVAGVRDIFQTLNASGVRYLVAGGLATVAHGYVRLTIDIDLVVDLEDRNLRTALSSLAGLGYRPRAPVPIMDFADPAKRQRWHEQKGMVVFQLTSDRFPESNIDLFAQAPFDFSKEYAEAKHMARSWPQHTGRLPCYADRNEERGGTG